MCGNLDFFCIVFLDITVGKLRIENYHTKAEISWMDIFFIACMSFQECKIILNKNDHRSYEDADILQSFANSF